MSEFIVVERDNERNIRFKGEKIGGASSRDNESTRWFLLRIYKTAGGKLVCTRDGLSQHQGEDTTYEAKVCATEDEAISYLGLSDTAKVVYDEAGIDYTVVIE